MSEIDYRTWARRAADWTADYLSNLRERRVKPDLEPGDILAMLPASPPRQPEDFSRIFADFERIVPDRITHWQHPGFMAYFPNNASPAAIIADTLVNAMSAQGMLWETSPAGTEVEIRMIEWLAEALGLPRGIRGVMHDSASSATLCAVLTMRERALEWAGNAEGLSGSPAPRIYASAQTHSSVDKAIWVSGVGQANLVKVATDANNAMDLDALEEAIARDLEAGFLPAGVIMCAGGTSIGAFDQIGATIEVAKRHGLYTHVDAAWAGNAMICPEFRHLWQGVEAADSIVMNPYKGLGSQFDGAVQFLADPTDQIRTLTLRPDYLPRHDSGDAINFSEWSVPLGRRFRALKLWFLMRAYGIEGLETRMRNHVLWARHAAERIGSVSGLEITTPAELALFTFRHIEGDEATRALLRRLNEDGRVYLAATQHEGRTVIRLQIGSFMCEKDDVDMACDLIADRAAAM